MNLKTIALSFAGAAAALACASTACAQAQVDLSPWAPRLPAIPEQPEAGSPYVIYPVRNGVYMIEGPGGNVAVQVGTDGVLVVDTGPAASAPGLVAQIRKLSNRPVRYVINTSADPDRIGGNDAVAKAGGTLEGGNRRPTVVAGSGGAPIWAHEGAMTRLAASGGEPLGWPTDTYFVDEKDLFFNGEPVNLLYAKAAHSGGDSLVMFRRSDVVVAGKVYTPDRYPDLDIENGGSIQGLLNELNHLLRLTVTEFNEEGGTFVIPASGRLSDEADVADYRDMVTFIHDRVKLMVGRRMTLAQIKAARPSQDYDTVYGAEAGDRFVEQIYRSLTAGQARGR